MKLPDKIFINDFSYELPDVRIAKYPPAERDLSKLLVYQDSRALQHDNFLNLCKYLPPNSHLVFNNTRVIYARLFFRKSTGATIELFCLKPVLPFEYVQVFQATDSCNWECIVGNAKRWKSGSLIKEVFINGKNVKLTVQRKSKISEDGSWNIEFSWDGNDVTFADILQNAGHIPIPPYMNRNAEDSDITGYQTVYSKIDGSVASPTAGLHFTERVFKSIRKHHIKTTEITLHVGAGTFQPVKASDIEKHCMHEEDIIITSEVIDNLLENLDNIVAVGTTSVRTLESLYWLGVKISKGYQPRADRSVPRQWECYEIQNDLHPEKALLYLKEYLKNQGKFYLKFSTQIMIVPGYKFNMVKGMITNFHQPKSTLLLLIAAFTGDNWKKIYEYALKNDFRFLSYGDSSLLLR